MPGITEEQARFLLAENAGWFGPKALVFLPLRHSLTLEEGSESLIDGRARLRAWRKLCWPDEKVPVRVVHDARNAARQLLVNGHPDRAFVTIEECWQDSPRSIEKHLGVPFDQALACYAARRPPKVTIRKAPKRESLRTLKQVRAYLCTVAECGNPVDVHELLSLLG